MFPTENRSASVSFDFPDQCDIAILGGGLSGCLLLHALKSTDPQKSVLLFESSDKICGNHTWSFHESDVPTSVWSWLRPLVSHSWPNYTVHFPKYSRTLPSAYHSISSEDLREKLQALYRKAIFTKMPAQSWNKTPQGWQVAFPTGKVLRSQQLFDCRGWPDLPAEEMGFQKFIGLRLELTEPHGLVSPILKDVRVRQQDGYRFIYTLPFGKTDLLIEDTYYSNNPELNDKQIEEQILAYAEKNNWKIKKIIAREKGCLPLLLWPPKGPSLTNSLGARSLSFQPITGYTMPYTLRAIGHTIRTVAPKASANAEPGPRKGLTARTSTWQVFFLCLLNRMLFLAANPERRYLVLERFYRLPAATIARFYSGELKVRDALLLLLGKPPVPIGRALKAIFTVRHSAISRKKN